MRAPAEVRRLRNCLCELAICATSYFVQLVSSGDCGVRRMSPSNKTTYTAVGGYSCPPPCEPRIRSCPLYSTASCCRNPSSQPGVRNTAPFKAALQTRGMMPSIPCFAYIIHVCKLRSIPSARYLDSDALNSSVHTFGASKTSLHANASPVATSRSMKRWAGPERTQSCHRVARRISQPRGTESPNRTNRGHPPIPPHHVAACHDVRSILHRDRTRCNGASARKLERRLLRLY